MSATTVISPQLAALVAARRKERGLTQDQLAQLSGVHFATLNRLEKGERNARPETIEKLARTLGLPIGELSAAAGNLPPWLVRRVDAGEVSPAVVEDTLWMAFGAGQPASAR